MWLYQRGSEGAYEVGFFDPDGEWFMVALHEGETAAAMQVHYLNGGSAAILAALEMSITKNLGHLYDALQRGNNFRG